MSELIIVDGLWMNFYKPQSSVDSGQAPEINDLKPLIAKSAESTKRLYTASSSLVTVLLYKLQHYDFMETKSKKSLTRIKSRHHVLNPIYSVAIRSTTMLLHTK